MRKKRNTNSHAKSSTKQGGNGRKLTIKDLATTKFKRWPGDFPTEKIEDRMKDCTASFTLAAALMQKSREELIAIHGKIPQDLMCRLYDDLETTAAIMTEVAGVMRCASLRILASGAARLERGQPFVMAKRAD